MTPTEALRRDHPNVADAAGWLAARRALLQERAGPRTDSRLAASSGCAASGAHTHAQDLAQAATHALTRLEAGALTRCEVCDAVLPLARLEAAPAAVRCTGCVRPDTFDSRWCR